MTHYLAVNKLVLWQKKLISLILKYQLFSPQNLYCIKLGGRDGWYFSVD